MISLPRAAVAALLVITAACSPSSQEEPAASQALGEELYETRCAMCHGMTGAGDMPMAAGYPNANLIDQRWAHGPEKEALVRVIRDGLPGTPMLGFGRMMSPEEIDAVAEYVRGLSR